MRRMAEGTRIGTGAGTAGDPAVTAERIGGRVPRTEADGTRAREVGTGPVAELVVVRMRGSAELSAEGRAKRDTACAAPKGTTPA
jgi:hypothetical protein